MKKMQNRNLFKQILGKHIRQQREEQHLTLQELAFRICMDDKHLGRIERGEKLPSTYTLAKIQLEIDLSSEGYLREFEATRKEGNEEDYI